MADDLDELRRRRKAEFRRKQEERRQKTLREAQSLNTAAMAPPKPPPDSKPESALHKKQKIAENKEYDSMDKEETPKKTYFPSSSTGIPKAIAPYSKASPSSSVSFSQSPGTKRKRSRGYLDSDSSDDDDEAFLAAARRMEQRKKQRESDLEKNSSPQPPVSMPKKPVAASLFQDNGSDSDDDRAIMGSWKKLDAKRKERESKESMPEDPPPSVDPNKTPRNPLALMKENSKNTYTFPPQAADVAANLWSDSEDEEQADSSDDKKKKRKNTVQNKERKQEDNRKSGNVELPNGLDEEAEKHKLMPEFDNPKFGPFPLEPLPLKRSPDAETHDFTVPASINRYLPEYQRVGIQFVYESVMARKGAILGDGTY